VASVKSLFQNWRRQVLRIVMSPTPFSEPTRPISPATPRPYLQRKININTNKVDISRTHCGGPGMSLTIDPRDFQK